MGKFYCHRVKNPIAVNNNNNNKIRKEREETDAGGLKSMKTKTSREIACTY
jgi:hypothetical protein